MSEYIERDVLKQRIVDEQTENHVGIGNAGYEIGYHNGLSMAMAMVLTAPAADVAPVVHGRWIHDINNLYGCSECLGRETMSHKKLKPYCPNCGARMDGEYVDL